MIVVEFKKLVKLFENVLLYKASPYLDAIPVKLTTKGLAVDDSSISAISIVARYFPKYFIKYAVSTEEEVVFTKTMLKNLKSFLKNEELIQLRKEDDALIFEGTDSSYEEKLPELEFTPPTEIVKRDNIFLPKDFEPVVVAIVEDPALANMPKGDYYVLRYDSVKNTLNIQISEVGTFRKKIICRRIDAERSAEITLDSDIAGRIFANTEGIGYLAFNDDMFVAGTLTSERFLMYITYPIAEISVGTSEEEEVEEEEEEEEEE